VGFVVHNLSTENSPHAFRHAASWLIIGERGAVGAVAAGAMSTEATETISSEFFLKEKMKLR